MSKKNLAEYKRKYNSFRHHAWAGLGFLSILLAIRIVFPSISELILPVLIVLIIYVLVALIFTYKYLKGLNSLEHVLQIRPSDEIEKEKINTDNEKDRLKVEKKKTKSETKKAKKTEKIK